MQSFFHTIFDLFMNDVAHLPVLKTQRLPTPVLNILKNKVKYFCNMLVSFT